MANTAGTNKALFDSSNRETSMTMKKKQIMELSDEEDEGEKGE